MGKILIFVILAVTIPRWALTLQQVDKFGFFNVPITALGEAIVLEIGNYYLLRIYNKCRARALLYRNDWESLDERNREQGKKTRKARQDPALAGYWMLPIMLLFLEGLTVIAQTPYIAGQLLGKSATAILSEVHWIAVLVYAFLLVIAPGIMTVAIAFGVHYEEALRHGISEQPMGMATEIVRSLTNRLTKRPTDRPSVRPTVRPIKSKGHATPATDQPSDRYLADTDRTEVSEAFARHLATLRDFLQKRQQVSPSFNGRFRRADVERMLGLGGTQAKSVIRYGLNHGVLVAKDRFRYEFTRFYPEIITDDQPEQ